MKTPYDPRHIKRQKTVKNLFRWSFQSKQKIENKLAKSILDRQKKIDKIIAESAPDWPIEQINRIDLAILRLAVYELVIVKKEPPKVIIDEAVELAKRYGSEKSSSFVNGVLGTILKKMTKLEKKIINLISENLGIAKEEVTLESSLRKDLGAETLSISDLLAKIQEEFNIDLEEGKPEKLKTVRQLINLVTAKVE